MPWNVIAEPLLHREVTYNLCGKSLLFFFQWERLQPLVLFVKESYSLKNIIIHLIHFEEPEKQMRRNIKMANLNISISDV